MPEMLICQYSKCLNPIAVEHERYVVPDRLVPKDQWAYYHVECYQQWREEAAQKAAEEEAARTATITCPRFKQNSPLHEVDDHLVGCNVR
jgi:hypothetical protein